MREYRHPEAFVEEVTLPRSIDGVPTSTALFLGHATDGPRDRAVKVTSFGEYARVFGGIADLRAAHAANPDLVPAVDHLGHAVLAFFENGGRVAFVRRMSTEGRDALPLREPAAFRSALDDVEGDPGAREASVLALPGLAWDASGRPALDLAVGHCARWRRRIALLDLPADAGSGARAVAGLGLPASSFAAAYHPWLVVTNPLHDPASAPDVPATVTVPPSGFVAGLLARTDLERGVFAAPAGSRASLRGTVDVASLLDARSVAALTRANVNAIRRLDGGAPVVWGARTQAPAAEPEWRSVNVRRLCTFLERSIDQGTEWAVFEPNAAPLWVELRRIVDGFLYSLWHAGAFAGTRPQEAYFVRCGPGDTMTQDDIDHGIAIVEVGVAPLRPAEFVILRFAIATASAV